MPIIKIFIHVMIVLLTVGLTYVMTINVKFAKHKTQAISEMKYFFFLIFISGLNLFIAYSLFKEFNSPIPLNKTSLFLILIYSFVLFNSYVCLLFMKQNFLLKKIINL